VRVEKKVKKEKKSGRRKEMRSERKW
jgi:hypothetical protein